MEQKILTHFETFDLFDSVGVRLIQVLSQKYKKSII